MLLSLRIPIKVLELHAHLSTEHARILLGENAVKEIQNPVNANKQSFYTGHELSVVGPKGVVTGVKVWGPLREKTQIEISYAAISNIGITGSLRDSCDLEDSPGAFVIGPAGSLTLTTGVIIPASHIHMNEEQASRLSLRMGDRVKVLLKATKTLEIHDLLVTVDKSEQAELHLNLDEANAAMVNGNSYAMIKIPEQPYFYDHEGEAVPVPGFNNVRISHVKTASSPLALVAINLCTNIFEFTPAEKRRMVSNLLKVQRGEDDNYFFLVAYEGDEVIAVTSTYYLPDVKLAFMEFIAVHPERQKKGIGTFVYHQTLDAIKRTGKELKAIVFEVRSTKDGLKKRKNFFLSLGAMPIDLQFYPIGHKMDEDLMLMLKPLAKEFCLNSSILIKFFSSLSKTLID